MLVRKVSSSLAPRRHLVCVTNTFLYLSNTNCSMDKYATVGLLHCRNLISFYCTWLSGFYKWNRVTSNCRVQGRNPWYFRRRQLPGCPLLSPWSSCISGVDHQRCDVKTSLSPLAQFQYLHGSKVSFGWIRVFWPFESHLQTVTRALRFCHYKCGSCSFASPLIQNPMLGSSHVRVSDNKLVASIDLLTLFYPSFARITCQLCARFALFLLSRASTSLTRAGFQLAIAAFSSSLLVFLCWWTKRDVFSFCTKYIATNALACLHLILVQ